MKQKVIWFLILAFLLSLLLFPAAPFPSLIYGFTAYELLSNLGNPDEIISIQRLNNEIGGIRNCKLLL